MNPEGSTLDLCAVFCWAGYQFFGLLLIGVAGRLRSLGLDEYYRHILAWDAAYLTLGVLLGLMAKRRFRRCAF